MLKKILAVVVALIAAFVVVFIGDALTHRMFPPPPRTKMNDPKEFAAFVATIPTYVFAFMFSFWILSSFVGGLVAGKINSAGWKFSSVLVGTLLMTGAILNMVMIPHHPMWMMIAAIVLYIPAAYLGGKLAAKA